MRIRFSWKIALIALAILAALVLWWASRRLVPVVTDLGAVIDAELEAQLNREVSLESARIVSRDRVVITGLRIAQGESFEEGTLLTVRRVVADVNLLPILAGGSIVANVRRLTMIGPDLTLIRDAEGRLNIADLLEPPVIPTPAFRGLVVIEDGRLTVRDFASLLTTQPGINTLESIEGTIDARPADVIQLDLRGQGTQERIGQLVLRGPLGRGDPRLTSIRATISDADAGYWLDYFSTIRTWALRGGVLNGTAVIYQTADEAFTARGSASVEGGTITSPHLAIPLRQMDANVSFDGTSIRLQADALLRGSPVSVAGTIEAGESLNLRVTSDRMDPLTLQQAVRALPTVPNSTWPTPMSFNAAVFGPDDALNVRATASIPRAVIYGVPATNITASGSYADGIIRISNLRAGVAGGTGRFNAIVRLQTGLTTVNGTLNNISLARADLPIGVPVTGAADATISLEWLRGIRSGRVVAQVRSGSVGGFTFASASLRGTFTGLRTADGVIGISGGSIADVPITSARANLALRGNVINVSQGVINTARGTVRTSGTVTTAGALNLAVNATNVDLQALLGPLGYEQVAGIAEFSGRLTGTIASPLLSGTLTARNGRLQQIVFDFLSGQLTATPEYILLADATIRRAGTEIATTGFVRIPRAAPIQVDLRLVARQADIPQLAAIFGIDIDVAGTADVDVRVTGRLPDLQFAGTIAVTDAVIAGLEVDSARVALRSVAGRTVIDQLVAMRDGMRLIGSGVIGPQGQLSISVVGENLSLSLLNQALSPYVVLSGPMDFAGNVTGTIADPRVTGQVISPAPVVNEVPFDRLAGDVRWDGTTLSLTNASLTREDVLYSISILSFNTVTESVVLETTLSNARLERVLALFRNSPYVQTPEGETLRDALETIPDAATGDIEASLSLSGPLGDLTGSGTISGSDIVLGEQQISALDIGFVAQRSAFFLSDLAIRAPGVDLDAAAQFVAAEPTALQVNIRDTQVPALLTLIENLPFLPLFEFGQDLIATAESIPRPVTGLMDATVSVTNIRTGATGAATLTITGLSIEDEEIGTLTAAAQLVGGAVFIERFDLTGPLATASIRGNIAPDQTVSLSGTVEGVSLALLGPLIGVPHLTGTLDMDLVATGTLDAPVVEASITAVDVSTPQVTFDSVIIPSLVIQADRLDAPQITATADGSVILGSASLPFTWAPPFIPRDQPLNVQAAVPDQDLGTLTGLVPLVQSASGNLAVNLLISGTIDDPVLSGGLVITDGVLDVARFNNSFTGLQVEAVFSNSTLQISRFTGGSSLGGTFEVTGSVEIPSLRGAVADATLAMNGLRISTENLTGIYEEEITMTATGLLSITEGLAAPLISGDLIVSDAVIEVPVAELPTPGIPGFVGPNPRFDVTLNLASNVRIERGPLEVEVVGPVSIAGTLAQPDIVGTVLLTDGTLRYPGRTFTLVPGGVATFVWEAPAPPSIAVDLRATTRVLAPSPFFARFTRYTIFLDVSGTIDSPVISVSSSPPGLTEIEALALIFRQAEIEALLRGVDFFDIIEQQLAETLLGLALPGIFEGIEFGPFTVGLEAGLAVPLQAWISLQITEQLALSYLSTLIAGEQFDILELSYLISPQYAFSIQLQNNAEVLYLLQAGWRF